MTDLEKAVIGEIKSAVHTSILKLLGDTYSSPLKPFIKETFERHGDKVKTWLSDSINMVMLDEQFKEHMREGMRKKIAREITNTFGEGIFKRSIEKLKSDPTLKARCVLAVEKILQEED